MYGLMNIKKMFARDTVRKKTENNNKKNTIPRNSSSNIKVLHIAFFNAQY